MSPEFDVLAEQLFDTFHKAIGECLRRAHRVSRENVSTIAGWAGVTDESAKSWMRVEKPTRISLAHFLVLVRRSRGPFKQVLLDYLRKQIGNPPPAT